MAHSTSSNTATYGSEDQYASTSNAPPTQTTSQIAANAAISRQWTATYIADPTLPVVAPSSFRPNPIASRIQAANTNIAKFDAAFNNGNNSNGRNNMNSKVN
ncbi:hypothetical protein ONS96_003813 [Cadophora gregata f. sp. sojae]|nr:hypothetical protein ONS96_003813 [Cadophora gregata f. sp. sojae]